MTDAITKKDREIVRDLARRQAEIAALPVMEERARLWTAHNDLRGERPMVFFEPNTVGDKGFVPETTCETELGRQMELQIKWAILNHERIGDDRVVTAEFLCPWRYAMTVFDMPVRKTVSADGVGFHIEEQIADLTADMDKIKPSSLTFDREGSLAYADRAREVLGDILSVRMSTMLTASITNELVHRMGMENMFVAMMDTPDEFHTLMGVLTDGYLRLFDELEKRQMLSLNHANDWVCQGTFGYTTQLPTPLGDIRVSDLWGYADSQETVGISPAMFGEFFFPYYQRVAERYGLTVYGCCEPVHPFWKYIGTLSNLRKVSISPWCDEAFMGEQLRGKPVIYQRKPSPNFVGVGKYLDEDAFRAYIDETLHHAKGCRLEFTFRDVYTLSGELDKPRRAVEIVREEIAKHW